MGSPNAWSFDVFFSYNSRDHLAIELVARALRERGLRVFIDRWYLTPGQPWPQALERTLGSCGAVAVFLGVEGLGPWQQRERDLALDRQGREPDFPVIPVLLTRADPALGFLRLNTWIDLSTSISDSRALEILCAAIQRRPPGAVETEQSASILSAVCPYRGLQPFREEDAALFCGRETFTAKLIDAVARTTLVAVVGASGCGKSSVVRAGLIPSLRETRSCPIWEIATLVPTDRPLHSLAATLVPLLAPEMSRVDRLAETQKLARLLGEGSVALRDVVTDVLKEQPGTDRLLLLVDQWEELYTLVPDEATRRRFLAEILDATERGPLSVVLTLRGDFFGQALSDRALADRLQDGQVNLGPMTLAELRRSMTEPAKKVGLSFQSGLVDRILEDLGEEPGNLPLLEFVLTALWEQRQGGILLHDAYDGMGGVQGAIAARADAELRKLDAAQQQAARRYLVQMVRPGEEREDTRQRAPLPIGNATALTALRRLADARLVVTTRDAASGEETVEVAHEALIRNWALLRDWVDADRERLRTKARIEAAAALWEHERRDPSRLLPAGGPLAEGEGLLASGWADLRPSVVAFIEASSAAAARMRRRRRAAQGAGLAAGVLAILGGLLYWDLYVREHAEFYNAFAKRWGVFEGIGPVESRDVARRSRTLRFLRQGRLGPVTRVEAVDSSGGCARLGLGDPTSGTGIQDLADDPRRVCALGWTRDNDGRLTGQVMLDAAGRIAGRLVYTDGAGLTADFRNEGGWMLPIGTATTVTYERIAEGPNRGQDRMERYSDAAGQPKPFLTGSFAAHAEYSPLGLVTRVVWLGPDDRPMRDSAGFAEVRVEYDAFGNPVKNAFFDENGNPILTGRGSASVTMAYDTHGNLVEEAYFDAQGQPTSIDSGYAKLILTYDERGRETSHAYFDELGKPTPSKNGYARVVSTLDPLGRAVEEAYFDERGQPTLCTDGYAKFVKSYDESGNPVESAYFDQDGKPIRSKDGYAKAMRVYNALGQLIESAYFDPRGEPTRSKDGYAKRRLAYDKLGNPPLAETYFDPSGRPTLSNDGYARVVKRYDGAGHTISEAYFDDSGQPTLSKEGFAKRTIEYDELGREARERYFDGTGEPITAKSGAASIAYAYDARGHLSRRSYFERTGRPTLSKNKYATLTRINDARGKTLEEAFFDEEGRPCLSDNGVAKATMEYDARGNMVKQTHFDESGRPTRSSEGVGVISWKYDTSGNMIAQSYFDESGNPMKAPAGYAAMNSVFDSRGRRVEEYYLDEAGEPTELNGYSKIVVRYDARGNQVENSYFDELSRPVRSTNGYARLSQSFDERDHISGQSFFDEASRPVRSKDGYARVTLKYDDRGNKVAVAFFDEVGQPTRSTEGYATLTQAFNDRGNMIEQAFFDEAGRPRQSQSGYAKITQVFDSRDNTIKAAYFDETGRAHPNSDGVSSWTAEYDERGNLIKARVFDATGKPTRTKDGYAVIAKTYNSRGNLIGIAYFDEKGGPIRSSDGYARVAKVYDARDRIIETAYFDEQGAPVRSRDGYAKSTKVYGTRGEVLEEVRYDEREMIVQELPTGQSGGTTSTDHSVANKRR